MELGKNPVPLIFDYSTMSLSDASGGPSLDLAQTPTTLVEPATVASAWSIIRRTTEGRTRISWRTWRPGT